MRNTFVWNLWIIKSLKVFFIGGVVIYIGIANEVSYVSAYKFKNTLSRCSFSINNVKMVENYKFWTNCIRQVLKKKQFIFSFIYYYILISNFTLSRHTPLHHIFFILKLSWSLLLFPLNIPVSKTQSSIHLQKPYQKFLTIKLAQWHQIVQIKVF